MLIILDEEDTGEQIGEDHMIKEIEGQWKTQDRHGDDSPQSFKTKCKLNKHFVSQLLGLDLTTQG